MTKNKILVAFVCCLIGAMPTEAKVSIPFAGDISSTQKKMSARFFLDDQTPLDVHLQQISATDYKIGITVNDLKTPLCEISTVMEGQLRLQDVNPLSPVVLGELVSQLTLINHRPVANCQGQFVIKDQILSFYDIKIGKIHCRGTVQLVAPFWVDLKVELNGVDIQDFIAFFAGEPELKSFGEVSGSITLKGPWEHLLVKGQLISYDGLMEALDYQSLSVNIEGIYPRIYLSNSDVTQTDGLTYTIKGNLDLSDQVNFTKQIEALAYSPMVNDDETGSEWTLKRLKDESRSGTTELKYLLRKTRDNKILEEEDSGLLGVEQKIKF
jgi:hypothetical protein